MRNLDSTVISQYSNSPVLCQLIENINTWLDPNPSLEDFYNLFYNIDTAESFGLDFWGRVVGVNRVLTVDNGPFLGFTGDTGASGDSFNVGIWYSGQKLTGNFALTDQAYRLLILAKAAANITNGSIPALNQILLNLFPNRGNCYVIDNQDMTMIYKFDFVLQPFEKAIVSSSGVLPTPAGVAFTVQSN